PLSAAGSARSQTAPATRATAPPSRAVTGSSGWAPPDAAAPTVTASPGARPRTASRRALHDPHPGAAVGQLLDLVAGPGVEELGQQVARHAVVVDGQDVAGRKLLERGQGPHHRLGRLQAAVVQVHLAHGARLAPARHASP